VLIGTRLPRKENPPAVGCGLKTGCSLGFCFKEGECREGSAYDEISLIWRNGDKNVKAMCPDVCKDKVTEIDISLLNSLGIKGLLIDLDNTLGGYDDSLPPQEVIEWMNALTAAGISVCIMSNNSHKERVSAYAQALCIKWKNLALKPLPFKMGRARKEMGLKRKEVLVVGDQVLTDLLAGKLGRMKTLLVTSVAKRKAREMQER